MADIPYRSGRGHIVKLGTAIWGNCLLIEKPEAETYKGEAQAQDGVHVFSDSADGAALAAPLLTKNGIFKFRRPSDITVPGALCTGLDATVSYKRGSAGTVYTGTGHVIEEGGDEADPTSKEGMIREVTVQMHGPFAASGTVGSPTDSAFLSPRGWSLLLEGAAEILSLSNWRRFKLPLVKTFAGEVQAGNGVANFGDAFGYTSYGEIPIEVADNDDIAGAVLTAEELTLTLDNPAFGTWEGLGHLTLEGGAKADPNATEGMIRRYVLAMHGLLSYTAPAP